MAASSSSIFDESKLTYHATDRPNSRGIGVLIIPGGGYQHICRQEADESVNYLNSKGYDAWVLSYSVALEAPTPLYPAPLNEALGAVSHIRGLGTLKKLGIWGYSAGGHLAAITLTNPNVDVDFGILTYPVISMDPTVTHRGSREALIGLDPEAELVYQMSAERAVTNTTPPVFVYHSVNDASVPVENALRFLDAMRKHARPFHALILPEAAHGIATGMDSPKQNWTCELGRFLEYLV